MGVSAAMICRNEERCIERCVRSVVDAVDEFVIVDTGSTDKTVSILKGLCEQYGPKIKLYHFEWVDDFAAARNYSLSQVTQDWVFVVDADDVLPESDQPKIRRYVDEWANRKVLGYIVYDNVIGGHIVNAVRLAYIRLFPSNMRYTDMIHEKIDYDETSGTMEVLETDIHLLHDGYDHQLVDQKGKSVRNLQLLQKNLRADPDNGRLWFQLGREMWQYDTEKALRYLEIAESKTTSKLLLEWIYKTRADIMRKQ